VFPAELREWLWHRDAGFAPGPVASWTYLHGWYRRGNWVAWIGSTSGGEGLVLHNRHYDVTVVFMQNGRTPGSSVDLVKPLMVAIDGQPGTSKIGQQWPCVPDPSFPPDVYSKTECGTYPY
jgi:hypothetical protein